MQIQLGKYKVIENSFFLLNEFVKLALSLFLGRWLSAKTKLFVMRGILGN
jgi:hypothetical protein